MYILCPVSMTSLNIPSQRQIRFHFFETGILPDPSLRQIGIELIVC